jgi:hypothetical protein
MATVNPFDIKSALLAKHAGHLGGFLSGVNVGG